MIRLGEHIVLEGFEVLGGAELLIVKKLVGSYVRELCTGAEGSQVTISLVRDTQYEVRVRALIGEKEHSSTSTCPNVFFAIDGALKKSLRLKNEMQAKN